MGADGVVRAGVVPDGAAPLLRAAPAPGERAEEIAREYREIELAVREGTLLVGHDGLIVEVRSADELIGLDAADLEGGPLLPPGWTMADDDGVDVDVEDHPGAVALRTGEVSEALLRYLPPRGSAARPRRLRFVAHPVEGDERVAVDVVVTDPDRREHVRRRLVSNDARFATLTEVLPIAVWEATPAGQITYVNPKFTELTGLDADGAPDLPMLGVVHPDDVVIVMEAATRIADGEEYHAQYRVVHVDGTARWVTSRMSVLFDDDGRHIGYVGAIEDVDELHRSRLQADRLADIVEAAGDAIVVSERGAVTYLNRSARMLLARFDVDDATPDAPFGSQLAARYLAELEPTLIARGRWSGEATFVDGHGQPIVVWIDAMAEVDGDRLLRTVLMARDIEAQKRREESLAHAATHDPLTGLVNRAGLLDALASSGERTGALMYVDIDHFKAVNDVHGHGAGDDVLVEVASRVRATVPRGATVARVGGDEMIVWVPGAPEMADGVASDVVAAVAAASVEIRSAVSEAAECTVTATVGVARGRGDRSEDLMRRADAALYAAKRRGRGGYHVAADADADADADGSGLS